MQKSRHKIILTEKKKDTIGVLNVNHTTQQVKMKGKSLTEIEKIADFYMVDVSDLFDDPNTTIKNSMIKLNHEEVCEQDFESISRFGRIIKNYLKMQELRPLEDKREDKLNIILNKKPLK